MYVYSLHDSTREENVGSGIQDTRFLNILFKNDCVLVFEYDNLWYPLSLLVLCIYFTGCMCVYEYMIYVFMENVCVVHRHVCMCVGAEVCAGQKNDLLPATWLFLILVKLTQKIDGDMHV